MFGAGIYPIWPDSWSVLLRYERSECRLCVMFEVPRNKADDQRGSVVSDKLMVSPTRMDDHY